MDPLYSVLQAMLEVVPSATMCEAHVVMMLHNLEKFNVFAESHARALPDVCADHWSDMVANSREQLAALMQTLRK